MSTDTALARENARQSDGRFGVQVNAESSMNLSPETSSLTPSDIETLRGHKGALRGSYTARQATAVLSLFESAHLSVYWDVYDGHIGELDGDPLIVGTPACEGDFEHWRTRALDGRVLAYLTDPDSDEDPATFQTLLDARHLQPNVGEIYTFDIDGMRQHAFSLAGEDVCANPSCNESLDDGQRWDGYCGHHSDLIYQHEQGEHEGAERPECPEC